MSKKNWRFFFMVALEFNWIYYTLIVFISALVPGMALGIPFLKKSELSRLEKLLLCFFIGLVVPPSMLLLENIAGLKFSLFLAAMNIFIVTAAGILWGMKEGAFSMKMPEIRFEGMLSADFAYRHVASVLLLFAVILAFWIRLQSFSPIYSELDPYYYVYGSGQIIRFGEAPHAEDLAWWPELKTVTHRAYPPLKMYIEAQLYSAYTGGGAYDKYLLFTTSCWLPPIMAALMAFGGYLLFSSYYGKRYGILAAFLVIFLPITLYKMSAGVNEAGPEGMAAVFLVLGTYSLALRKNDLRIGILSGLAFFFAILASNYDPVISIPLAGFIGLQAVDYFARGKKHDGFLQMTTALVAGMVIAYLAYTIYSKGLGNLPGLATNTQILLCLSALAGAYALERVGFFTKMNGKQRRALLIGAAILGLLVLIVPNPAGKAVKGVVGNYMGAADFTAPLLKTIAEQNQAGASFEGEAGFLALVPKNYILGQPADLYRNIVSFACRILDVVASAFTAVGNAGLQFSASAANALFGLNISTGQKSDSLLFFFLIAGSAGLAWNYLSGHGGERNVPSIAILLLLLVLPTTYIGLNKIKYTIFIGLTIVVAAVATVAELERAALWLARKTKRHGSTQYVGMAFAVLIVLLVAAQATFPSNYQSMILSKSFETRYQDNPTAAMPKLASMCEFMRTKGFYDQEVCAAGYNADFANTIDSQFNQKVCLVSQLSADELFPGPGAAEQQKSGEAKAGASYRCNRLSDYWVDSMDWISKNVPDDGRVLSWWDYGHWINYFGQRKAVIRNEQASYGMIGRTAHDFLIGSNQDIIDSMNYFDSQYVLFDSEIIGGQAFGGKYGALNYLGCTHEGLTSVKNDPGSSRCEYDHSPERLFIPKVKAAATACTISESQQRTGVYAYRITMQGVDMQKPAYCIGDVKLADGSTASATYYLDRKDADGDLVLSKGFIRATQDYGDSVQVEMVYNLQKAWPGPNGTWVDGMEDAKTDFYRSNLYGGFYLETLPGFDLVYKSKNGEVKIFRMKDPLFKGNKEGWVDPETVGKIQ